MKKFLLLVALLPLALSCSHDDDAVTETPFFNLAEGNIWVYRRYNSDGQGQNPVATNQTDTVRVVGQEIIQGVSYFKLTHTLEGAGDIEYLRIDTESHLVNNGGYVIHPGTDSDYKFTWVNQFGTVDYELKAPYNDIIEGANYELLPFEGYFNPAEENIQEGVTDIKAYAPGVGIVIRRGRYISSLAYFEYRLVSHELH